MSNSEYDNEMDRYFNDPEYRRQKANKEKKSQQASKEPNNYSLTNMNKRSNLYRWIGIIGGICVILLGGFVLYLYSGMPSIEALENPKTAVASKIKSRDGVVIGRFYTQNRTYVPYEDISKNVVNALIATEDHRFYSHWGVDVKAIFAAIADIATSGNIRGASTISQQLARNLYKKIGREFSFIRKLREMLTAIQIEKNYTKREIIEMYLNTVEFPNSSYGIQTAAQTHYGKDASKLNVSEAATLIGSLRAVYFYNPRINPENAKRRQNVVLMQLQKRGFIADSTYNNLLSQKIALDYHPPSEAGHDSKYFAQYVRKQVKDWASENEYNLNTDGLTIYTTINSELQLNAQKAVEAKLDSLQPIFENEWTSANGEFMDTYWKRYPGFLSSFIEETDRYKNGFSKYDTDQRSVVMEKLMADEAFVDSVKHARTQLQAGFVGIDPQTGAVRFWIGGSDYSNTQFDHVYQSKRQTGSTFKPFVYTVAIDNGYKPYYKISNAPPLFYQKGGKAWSITNYGGGQGGMVSLRQALARSLNNATVNLLPELAGSPGTNKLSDLIPAAKKIKKMAQNMGIDLEGVKPYPSIALGTADVSLLELVSAYTTFANEGVHIEPHAITRIEDKSGNIIKEFQSTERQEVISPETAYMMVDMLRNAIRGGPGYYGTGIRLRTTYNVTQDIAGKTGTTDNSADNWFVGMTPQVVMGAWVGGSDRRIRFPKNSYTGQGAHAAMPIIGKFIQLAKADPEANWSVEPFDPPPGFVMPKDRETNRINTGTGRIDW